MRIGFVTALSFALCAGCNKSTPNDAANSTSGGSGSDSAPSDPATNAIAHAASDWLDAVLKGDTQRASARLTPQAMKRIVDSGKQFAPPGLETASFRIGEVRAPSQDQAIVQCVLTDSFGRHATQRRDVLPVAARG